MTPANQKEFRAVVLDDELSAIANMEELLKAFPEIRVVEKIHDAEKAVEISRKKREATLVKDGKQYKFPIPLLNIRKLERILEQ